MSTQLAAFALFAAVLTVTGRCGGSVGPRAAGRLRERYRDAHAGP